MVQMTLSYGLFEWSAASLSAFGVTSMLVMGEVDTSQYIGERALQMQERLDSEAGKAKTLLVLHNFVFPHVKPLQSFSNPFLEGYQSGMRTGDKAMSMWCLYFYVILQYIIGKPLNVIKQHYKCSITQMVELKEEDQASCLSLFWQLCFNLMGSLKSTVEPGSKAMHEKEVVFDNPSRADFVVVKTVMSSLFGRYKQGA
eukprot:5412722-Ditylum_brightwellii.AAC.1